MSSSEDESSTKRLRADDLSPEFPFAKKTRKTELREQNLNEMLSHFHLSDKGVNPLIYVCELCASVSRRVIKFNSHKRRKGNYVCKKCTAKENVNGANNVVKNGKKNDEKNGGKKILGL